MYKIILLTSIIFCFSPFSLFANVQNKFIVKEKINNKNYLLSHVDKTPVKDYIQSFSKNYEITVENYRLNNHAENLMVNIHEEENEIYLIKFSEKNAKNIDATLNKLMKSGRFEYIEPLYPLKLLSNNNDAQMNKNQTYLSETNLKELLTIPVNKVTTVAVIDTGVDRNHSKLKPMIFINNNELPNGEDDDNNGVIDDIYGSSFLSSNPSSSDSIDQHGHGTHLAGIIAGQSKKSGDVRGLNKLTQIIPIKIFDQNGSGNQLDAARSIYYATGLNVDIINCSWGFTQYNSILKKAIDYAIKKGVIIVAASGNGGNEMALYPAAFDGVISIGSITLKGKKSDFSNYGKNVDFFMYGEDIYSLLPNESEGYLSGTSQSTAIMTGIISTILSNGIPKSNVENLLSTSFKKLAINNMSYYTLDIPKLVQSVTEHTATANDDFYSIETTMNQ